MDKWFNESKALEDELAQVRFEYETVKKENARLVSEVEAQRSEMKTPKEWLDWIRGETNDPNQKGYTYEVLLTEEAIGSIQTDAFEAGRVAGLREAVDRLTFIGHDHSALKMGDYLKGVESGVW